jgi:ABC-2 type transport system permease protein
MADRGVSGDILSLLLWSALGVVAFALAILHFGPGFLDGAIRVKGAGDRQLVTRQKADKPFHPGAGAALRRKELKQLARDPWLFSRALLQLLYIAPVCIVIWMSRSDPSLSLLVAPVLIMVLSHLAGILAWLTILNEDAVDFMATAPVTQDAILRSKLHAVALPLGFILLGPALALGWSEPFNALLMVIFATAACVSTALVNIWHPAPAKLEAATSRHNPPKIVALKENMLSVFWAVACGAAISGETYWVYYALGALLFLWFNRPRRRALA